jgi:hypothetical protein
VRRRSPLRRGDHPPLSGLPPGLVELVLPTRKPLSGSNCWRRMIRLDRELTASVDAIGAWVSPPVGWQHPAQTPLVGSHRTANAGSKTGRGRRSMGIGGWLFAIFFVALGLYFLSFSAQQFYRYQVGTPTTATGIKCRYGAPDSHTSDDPVSLSSLTLSEGCTAAWSVGGQSQTGPIVGVQHLGSSLNVHVNGGTAFTAPSAGWYFYRHILFGLFLIVLGLGRLWDVGRLWRWMKPARR